MRIEKTLGHLEELSPDGRQVDYLYLDHYDLNKPHQRVTTQGGRELAISLPHGQQLFPGAVLYADDSLIIAVDLLEEDVYVVQPVGNLQWARVCFNIGNMHQPAYLTDEDVCVPYDPVLERIFRVLGVKFQRTRRKLDGQRAGIAAGTDHSHGPGDGHQHPPGAADHHHHHHHHHE